MLTLETMTSPHRRGTDVWLAALNSFLGFVAPSPLPPAQANSLEIP